MTRVKKARIGAKKSCKWYTGRKHVGAEIRCLPDGKSRYSRVGPKSWKYAFGPYKTAKEARRVAAYQGFAVDGPIVVFPRRKK